MCCTSVRVKKRDEAYPGNVARYVRTWRRKWPACMCIYDHTACACFGAQLPLCRLYLQRAPATSTAKGKKFFKSVPMALNYTKRALGQHGLHHTPF